MESRRPNLESFLRWACDGFVVVFGLWSVLSQAVALAGGSARLLERLSLLIPLPAAAILYGLGRAAVRNRSPQALPALTTAGDRELPQRPCWPALVGAVVLAAYYALAGGYVVFWATACLFLGWFYIQHLSAPALGQNPLDGTAGSKAEFPVLALLAVVILASTLLVHRMHYDDSLYVGVAADVVDHPDEPIMGRDTMHGVPGLPFIAPQHRVRTYDVLVGSTARALGLSPIAAAHMLFPPLWGLVFLAAAARLLRLLLGRAWLFGLAAVVMLLLINGDSESSFGNSAFVLLFQGKAILPTVMVPLLAAYGLEHVSGLRPAPSTLGLIGLGLAASVSLSTNGLFLGPLTVGLASAAAWRPDRRSTIRLMGAAAIGLMPIGLGLFLRANSVPEAFYMTTAMKSSWLYLLQRSMNWVWGGALFQSVWLLALLGGWAFVPDRSRRRWMLGYSWLFLLLVMNPLLTAFWARSVTSSITLFRLFWAIPLPCFLAALITGPLFSVRWLGKPGLRPALLGLGLAVFAILVPERWTTGTSNGALLDRPRPKVIPTFYATAKELAAATPRGGMVLAPEPVSSWIPTIPSHPPAVVVRRMFLGQFRDRMGADEYRRRLALLEYVSGDQRLWPGEAEMDAWFGSAIENLNLRGLAVQRSNRWLADIHHSLRARGFHRIPSPSRHFLLYIRNEPLG